MMHSTYSPMSRRRSTTIRALLLSTLLCVALIAARVVHSETLTFAFLVWNIFLAWIPFWGALRLYDAHRRGRHTLLLLGIASFWFLFYPNAPYIITDFVHLHQRPGVPLWFDLLMIASSAWTGMLLGFVSLYLVQRVVRERFGWFAGWAFVLVANAISGFGIYLGRFQRWNSWDLLVQPGALLADIWSRIAHPFGHPQTVGVSIAFGAFLVVGYMIVASLLHFDLAGDEAPARIRRS
jgi:uncharacterized membrane protein